MPIENTTSKSPNSRESNPENLTSIRAPYNGTVPNAPIRPNGVLNPRPLDQNRSSQEYFDDQYSKLDSSEQGRDGR